MWPLVDKTKAMFLDILFPPACLACEKILNPGEKTAYLCAACWDRIPIYTAFTCPFCGARLAENKKTCHRNTSYRLAAATDYGNEIVKQLVWRLKYDRRTTAAEPLAKILLAHLATLTLNLADYAIIPMPLHPRRERERGFNQSALIGKKIADALNLPLFDNLLLRTRPTPPQAEAKSKEMRRVNVAGAFRVALPESLKDQNLILLDDVFTTGATINEAVAELRHAGARRVLALVIARA